ncbi:MAG: SirB2 family protein [Rubrivivax sp.]
MDYAAVKLVHQTAVTLSIAGFVLRGAASLAGAPWVRGRAAKTLPHIVDTVLLLSALALAWMLRLSPTEAPWLMAKIVGLVLYVGLGVLALRPGRPPAQRAAAWVAALAVVGWIVSVAITKSAWGFLAPVVGQG